MASLNESHLVQVYGASAMGMIAVRLGVPWFAGLIVLA